MTMAAARDLARIAASDARSRWSMMGSILNGGPANRSENRQKDVCRRRGAGQKKKRRACARRRRVGGEPSKVVRHRESEIARRAGVLHPSEVRIRARSE